MLMEMVVLPIGRMKILRRPHELNMFSVQTLWGNKISPFYFNSSGIRAMGPRVQDAKQTFTPAPSAQERFNHLIKSFCVLSFKPEALSMMHAPTCAGSLADWIGGDG